MFFDGDAVNSIEFHGHGPASPKGVAADILPGESKLLEAQAGDGVFESSVDVGWKDLLGEPGEFKVGAQSCVVVVGVGHDVGHTTGQGLDWAGGQASAVMVNALASFAILLV